MAHTRKASTWHCHLEQLKFITTQIQYQFPVDLNLNDRATTSG